ncbi:hypothetical protein UFOVP205_35 [uncultured Caudovirales phage]|uniref:Uncharacterized protein n=1 Tax=uncultured Caudovirales phage TaxID=2100421 RepID=A0A6J7WM82_9CAUD|nr:hypothetical protein UFOVP205_35 [uncultured Caudovirales phage]
MRQEQEPVAYINVEERKLEWAKPMSWNTPTTVNIPKISLYTTPPQRTEQPVDCERCNRLEEQAYDLVGKLRVANIKLSMQPQRTWVGLTDDEREQIINANTATGLWHMAKAIEAKLKEKNT